MARTERTHTPFFVNTMLLADSALQYIEKHRKYLRSFYGAATEPLAFEQACYGAMAASEQDYLNIVGNGFVKRGKMPSLELLMPTPIWILWAVDLGRIGRDDIPAGWLTQRVVVNGVKMTAEQAWATERGKLKHDSVRRQAEQACVERAIHSAAMQWATRFHAVRLLYDDGIPFPAPESVIDVALLNATQPLAARDRALFEAVTKVAAPAAEAAQRPVRALPSNLHAVAREVGRAIDL
jgi:hypothetical protein